MTLGIDSIPVWLKPVASIIKGARSLWSLFSRRRPKLVFAGRPGSGWLWGSQGQQQILTFRCQLNLTNEGPQDAVIIGRVRVGCGVFPYVRPLQDCLFCEIGGERIFPSFTPGPKIEHHTTTLLEITHPFEVKMRPPPRTKRIWFRIVVTDQFNRKHGKRVRLGKFG